LGSLAVVDDVGGGHDGRQHLPRFQRYICGTDFVRSGLTSFSGLAWDEA